MKKIPQEDYNKAKFHWTTQATAVLKSVFDMYGLGDFIPSVVETLWDLTEQYGEVIRGKDTMIKVIDKIRRPSA